MKQILEIFGEDIQSIYKNWVVSIIILFLMLLPSAYAWINIIASWDPYGETKGILVGVANNDKGAVFKDQEVNIGKDIIQELKGNQKLGWQFTTEDEAISKVKKGKFYASIVIPENFSEHILTVINDNPTHAKIDYYVNEKINAIAPKITNTGANSIVDSVSKSIIKTASSTILTIFNELGIELNQDLPSIENMKKMVFKLEKILPELEQSMETIDEKIEKAEGILEVVDNGFESLETLTNQREQFSSEVKLYIESFQKTIENIDPIIRENLTTVQADSVLFTDWVNGLSNQDLTETEVNQVREKGYERLKRQADLAGSLQGLLVKMNALSNKNLLDDEIAALNTLLSQTDSQQLALKSLNQEQLLNLSHSNKNIATNLLNNYSEVTSPKLNRIMEDAEQVLGDVNSLAALESVPDIKASMKSTNETLGKRLNELSELQKRYPEVKSKITILANKIREFDKMYNLNEISEFLRNDIERESDFFSEPVLLNQHSLFPIPNYGSAMSPFYTTLALWVGGTMLIALVNVDVVSDKKYYAYQIYLGRGLLFLVIGLMQALVVSVGNIVFLHIYAVEKLWYILFAMLISFVFITIVYTFVSVFGNIGKGLSILIMVLQISGSGGTFPVQVAPVFFQKINPLLPFTYAINLLRESVGGMIWSNVLMNILALLGYVAAALCIGLILKKPFFKATEKVRMKFNRSRIFH